MRSLQNDALILRMPSGSKERHLLNTKSLDGNPQIFSCKLVNIAKK